MASQVLCSRPVCRISKTRGDLFTVAGITNGSNATVYQLSTSAHGITVGDYVIAKGILIMTINKFHFVTAVSGANITVEDDNSASGS